METELVKNWNGSDILAIMLVKLSVRAALKELYVFNHTVAM